MCEMILLIFLAAFVAVDKGKKEIERGILKRGTLQGLPWYRVGSQKVLEEEAILNHAV